jgi:anti-sigma factor RsiW
MNVSADHLSEEILEKYAMEKLSDWESAPVEEHLLICQLCRSRLENLDEFVALMKLALADFSDMESPGKLQRVCVKTA